MQCRVRSEPSDRLAARNVAKLHVHENQMGRAFARGNDRGNAAIHGVGGEPRTLEGITTQLSVAESAPTTSARRAGKPEEAV